MLTFGLLNNFYVGPESHVWLLGIGTVIAFLIGSIITYIQSASYKMLWPVLALGIILILASFIVGWNLADIIMYRIDHNVPEQGFPEGFVPIGKR